MHARVSAGDEPTNASGPDTAGGTQVDIEQEIERLTPRYTEAEEREARIARLIIAEVFAEAATREGQRSR